VGIGEIIFGFSMIPLDKLVLISFCLICFTLTSLLLSRMGVAAASARAHVCGVGALVLMAGESPTYSHRMGFGYEFGAKIC